MGVFELFSKRQKRARGEMPDVYVYDELPQTLRVQIVHIITDAFGEDIGYGGNGSAASAYEFVDQTLCREFGVFELIKHSRSKQDSVFNFFLQQESTESALDVVELCFRVIQNVIARNTTYRHNTTRKMESEEAIDELNERFKEHGVGYQFESGEIIRLDSQFLHAEAVKPALAVLRNDTFKGANEEFLKAHEHYRHSRYKETLVDALKAFESTMMTICKLRGWTTQPTDTAKTLINVCMTNGLFPTYFDNQFTSIRTLLESGLPTVRNKLGGHGQGAEPVAVPEYLARYALNLTATTILLMVEAHQATK
ncbi:STM4504/CBY_0614 family protein [Comamonas koreensis]|uniref:Abortive infection protein-like C-terminal domain-containing protein n=1 Tax=Comamonas koreensis TaxID=160825 RepID=A0AAW4XRN7_9BURK|nr:hypothetical protein [Comamonas koreensis]MCD2163833.1 hypothetical protein [Comamonas koreensis]